jgi:hypothetical protein
MTLPFAICDVNRWRCRGSKNAQFLNDSSDRCVSGWCGAFPQTLEGYFERHRS